MGILSRFKEIMRANVNAIMDQAKEPEKEAQEYIRMLNRDLGAVKAETAAVLMNERRAKSQLDECSSEIKKLQRYAEKSVEAGNDSDSLTFLERKAKQEERLGELNAAYEQAASVAESMKQMQDKLVSDIGQLESRYAELKNKLAAVKVQEALHSGPVHSSINEMEEKADYALNRAMAMAELRSGASEEEELRKQLAQLEKNSASDEGSTTSTEDELAAMKARLNKKD